MIGVDNKCKLKILKMNCACVHCIEFIPNLCKCVRVITREVLGSNFFYLWIILKKFCRQSYTKQVSIRSLLTQFQHKKTPNILFTLNNFIDTLCMLSYVAQLIYILHYYANSKNIRYLIVINTFNICPNKANLSAQK